MPKLIEPLWSNGQYSSWNFSVAGRPMGSVNWSMLRDDPYPYHTSVTLASQHGKFVTLDEAKASVEKRVLNILSRMVTFDGDSNVTM